MNKLSGRVPSLVHAKPKVVRFVFERSSSLQKEPHENQLITYGLAATRMPVGTMSVSITMNDYLVLYLNAIHFTTSLTGRSDFHSAGSAATQRDCSADQIHLQIRRQDQFVQASAGQTRFGSEHSLWFVE